MVGFLGEGTTHQVSLTFAHESIISKIHSVSTHTFSDKYARDKTDTMNNNVCWRIFAP